VSAENINGRSEPSEESEYAGFVEPTKPETVEVVPEEVQEVQEEIYDATVEVVVPSDLPIDYDALVFCFSILTSKMQCFK